MHIRKTFSLPTIQYISAPYFNADGSSAHRLNEGYNVWFPICIGLSTCYMFGIERSDFNTQTTFYQTENEGNSLRATGIASTVEYGKARCPVRLKIEASHCNIQVHIKGLFPM